MFQHFRIFFWDVFTFMHCRLALNLSQQSLVLNFLVLRKLVL